MSEAEAGEPIRSGQVVPFPGTTPQADVTFNRDELRLILNLYGRMVADGEWRDYGIDFTRERAVFSVYRRSSEMPLYRIVKEPRLARRQGAYAVSTGVGMVLKRGHDLARVLRMLEKPLKVVPN